MTSDEIEAFFSNQAKRVPASPTWRDHKSRVGEKKARLPIEVGGVLSSVEMEITLKSSDPEYLVAVLITPQCIARLCIGPDTGHNNRVTGEMIDGPHYHDWSMNKHLSKREAASLPFCIHLPPEIVGRDAAFSWFLRRVGIESPDWMPVQWPAQGGFF